MAEKGGPHLLDGDTVIDEIIAKKGIHNYTDGLSEEKWEEVSYCMYLIGSTCLNILALNSNVGALLLMTHGGGLLLMTHGGGLLLMTHGGGLLLMTHGGGLLLMTHGGGLLLMTHGGGPLFFAWSNIHALSMKNVVVFTSSLVDWIPCQGLFNLSESWRKAKKLPWSGDTGKLCDWMYECYWIYECDGKKFYFRKQSVKGVVWETIVTCSVAYYLCTFSYRFTGDVCPVHEYLVWFSMLEKPRWTSWLCYVNIFAIIQCSTPLHYNGGVGWISAYARLARLTDL